MKTPSEYLIEQIEIFTSKFCFISVCYAYDYESDFHVIEITHDGSLKKNLDFAKWKTGVWHEFYKMYPSEDLLITKQGRLTNKSNILYEMTSHSEVKPILGDYSIEYLFDGVESTIFEQEFLAA